jgi:hypothetical protein
MHKKEFAEEIETQVEIPGKGNRINNFFIRINGNNF